MTEPHDTIETELQSMTHYDGEPTELWKRAVEQVEAEEADSKASRTHGFFNILNKPIGMRHVITGLATAAVLVLIASVGLPYLGTSPLSARQAAPPTSVAGDFASADYLYGVPATPLPLAERPYGPIRGQLEIVPETQGRHAAFDIASGFDDSAEPLAEILSRSRVISGSRSTLRPPTETSQDATRSVIRNVTMEIRTPDVAATFLKARQLVSDAGGEFIEDSSLTGEDDEARANLTLRVAPNRLSEVLNELRKLGVVASEQARSEDVTDQVVDLEARLRNEQRVEEELLELLESRTDADLSEILKLQSEIGRVRTNIERFIAQRDRIARLVGLAKVLVIIRPEIVEPVIEKPKEATMWDDFKGSIKDSLKGGVAFLSNTVAGLLGILVGGLIWWVALIAVALMVRRYIRTLPEPAP